MQNGVFTGVFGALTSEHRMAVISNNLANANTTGYKTDKLAFKDTMILFAHDQIREPLENLRSKPLFPEAHLLARVRLAVADTDFEQGPLENTGNPLDLALAGDGFFNVETPNGTLLTRNGSFCQNADGTIMTKQGFPLLGEGGAIVVPAGTKSIHVSEDGRFFADNVLVDTLAITALEDPTRDLEKHGMNMYKLRDGASGATKETFPNLIVNQGFLEKSNISVVTEMVNMIEVQRAFQANSKTMQTANELDSSVITKVARPA